MKTTITIFLFVLATTFGFSQTVSYGVRAGLNVSNLDFDPDATFDNMHRNGFAFGGFVDYGINDNTSVLIEIQWSAEGAKADELKADYLHLPIMLRFNLGDFTVGVGPQASLKIWGSNDAFSTFAASGIVGLEYMLTDELFIDARYAYGFTNILDEDLSNIEATSTNIQFGIGIKL
jgi:opacity protein-like surface antigen